VKNIVCFLVFVFGASSALSQQIIPEKSIFYGLNDKDSAVIYQCHVEDATTMITTASGQTITGTHRKSTITEKFVLKKSGDTYLVEYYTSTLDVFPNKKFSGLKIRERPYWEFARKATYRLDKKQIEYLLALERIGKEAIEYDFGITKYTTNQVIIKRRRNFKQLVIDGDHVFSRTLKDAKS
jgi:hypothetical protein